MKDNKVLDKSDKIILSNLEYNARIKEKDMAKLCHLSKDAIRYRIKRLEDRNIISGYSCFVDYTKLGGICYKIYLKLQGSEKDWNNLRKFVDSFASIFSRFEAQSDWNFGIVYFAKSPYEYYSFERQLFTDFGHIIQSLELSQMLDAIVFEPNFLIEGKQRSFQLFGEIKKTDLDLIDRKIIELLLGDSSLHLSEIANSIHLSPDAIKKRIQRLEKEGVIKKYISNINYQKIGFEIYKVFIWVKEYTQDVEKRVIDKLSTYNNVRNIIRMIGSWKIEVEFVCKNYDEFYNVLKELRIFFPENITSLKYAIFRDNVYYPSRKLIQ